MSKGREWIQEFMVFEPNVGEVPWVVGRDRHVLSTWDDYIMLRRGRKRWQAKKSTVCVTFWQFFQP